MSDRLLATTSDKFPGDARPGRRVKKSRARLGVVLLGCCLIGLLGDDYRRFSQPAPNLRRV